MVAVGIKMIAEAIPLLGGPEVGLRLAALFPKSGQKEIYELAGRILWKEACGEKETGFAVQAVSMKLKPWV
ncbi:hypothetical protein [Rufibacter immobilis]|uniref:hypothetical protein n=1 Tax=Rufibacter immobilis TaxID=1348778 RepID=UPI0035EFEE8D